MEFYNYPEQSASFEYFIWFNQQKFPVFQQILQIHDIYCEERDSFSDGMTTKTAAGVRKNVKKTIKELQKFAQILYTGNEIATIEMMILPDSFYGYPIRVQIKIFKLVFDLKIELGNNGIREIYDSLNQVTVTSNSILRSVQDISSETKNSRLSRKVLQIKNEFSRLSDRINNLKRAMEPFNTAQVKIEELMIAAHPLKTRPILQQPRNPNDILNDFMSEFNDIMTDKIEYEFKINWILNDFMSVDMIDILKETKWGLRTLETLQPFFDDRTHQVIRLCLQGIDFMIEQISVRLNKKNDAVYLDLKLALYAVDMKVEQNVLSILNLKKFDTSDLYRDNDIDCVKLMQDALEIAKFMSDDISSILRNIGTDSMRNFEDKFDSIMDKLSKALEIVQQKTEALFSG